MNLNSRIFDRIRVKPTANDTPAPAQARCNHPGCTKPGDHRAPMGRMREGEYFSFCMDHVREYNNSYNYFNGMSDDSIARFQKEAIIGHRPTWTMGVKNAGPGRDEPFHDPASRFRVNPQSVRRPAAPMRPRHGVAVMKALDTMGLEETASPDMIRARYKELVKQLHPDANGGDRSSEERLRAILQAYKHLKAARIV